MQHKVRGASRAAAAPQDIVPGTVVTAAGGGLAPDDVATTPDGSVYLLDSESKVDLVGSDGTLTQVASDSAPNSAWQQLAVSPDKHLFLEDAGNGVDVVQPNGTSTLGSGCHPAQANLPWSQYDSFYSDGIAVSGNGTSYAQSGNWADGEGAVCITDESANGSMFRSYGPLHGFALDGAGNLWTLQFTLTSGGDGIVYYDSFNLDKITRTGHLQIVASNIPFSPPDHRFVPVDVAVDANGNVFFADSDYRIYERTVDGSFSVVAGTGQAPVIGGSNERVRWSVYGRCLRA